MTLPTNLREALIEHLYDIYRDSISSDLKTVILYGHTSPGLCNLTDQELIDEYIDCTNPDLEEPDELIQACLAEMSVDKMLKS